MAGCGSRECDCRVRVVNRSQRNLFRMHGISQPHMTFVGRLLIRAFTTLVLLWSPLVAPAAALSGCCLEEPVCCVQMTPGSCAQCPSLAKAVASEFSMPSACALSPPSTLPAIHLPTSLTDIWRPPPALSFV